MAAHEIRSLSPLECPAAAAIIASNELWQSRYPYPAERATGDLQAALQAGDLVLGAFTPTLAGFAWVMPRGAFGRYPYLRLLAVSSDSHGGGAGAALLGAAEARFAGERQFFLMVSEFNERAQRFYQRQGYSYRGTVPDYARDGIAEQLWSKRLS